MSCDDAKIGAPGFKLGLRVEVVSLDSRLRGLGLRFEGLGSRISRFESLVTIGVIDTSSNEDHNLPQA